MKVSRGIAHPLGPSVVHLASQLPLLDVNFAVFARVPTLTLLLFPPLTSSCPVRDPYTSVPFKDRTGDVWHVLVHDLNPDVTYALTTPGAANRILSDPYARWIESPGCEKWMTVEGENFKGEGGCQESAQNAMAFLKSFPRLSGLQIKYPFTLCRFTAPEKSRRFDWGNDSAPSVGYENLIIYEAHVRALSHDGTFASAKTAIPYLKWLGITALQLMPVFEFNEVEMGAMNSDYKLISDQDVSRKAPVERPGNWWGYSPMSWFSPMNRYASRAGGGAAELKELVQALHENGIECFLDVVYNHSANASCSLHFLNVQQFYYIGKSKNDSFQHSNISGCGNTLSPNSPMMLQLVLDSLRWFVTEYRIDGFRIDAAGVLCRDPSGAPSSGPEVIDHICSDPVLKNVKLIVEGWDAGDQIGSGNMLLGSKTGFPRGDRFCEWNVEWRDAVRRFFRGDKGSSKPFCKALRGSSTLFGVHNQVSKTRPLGAHHGVNFVACHDGFSMADVVSYRKRKNTDGYAEVSFNCGAEGDASDPQIRARRAQQLRNFVFALAVSRGVPMITQGDEFGFSKQGISNSWNNPQLFAATLPDSPQQCDSFESLILFTREMLKLRSSREVLTRSDFFSHLLWLDESGQPRSSRKQSSPSAKIGYIAFSVTGAEEEPELFFAFNNGKHSISASLPYTTNTNIRWQKLVDTGSPASVVSERAPCPAAIRDIIVSRQTCVLYEGSTPGK